MRNPQFFWLALGWLLFASIAQAAVLIHTNDILGELEPCGCRSNPKGGLARHYTLIKRTEETYGARSALQLDGGDLFFSSTTTAPMLKKQAEIQAEFIAKALELTELDAAVPGEKDFSLGVSVFENLIKGRKFKFIASNLTRKNSDKFLEPYAIFTKKKDEKSESSATLRIAVLGIVGEEMGWPSELKTTSALKAAEIWVPELRKKADLVIVLSHLGFEKDQELAKKVKGIDVIVGSHTQSFIQEPEKINGAIILQTSFKNQYVGVLPLSAPLTEGDLKGYKMIGLDPGYDSPPGKPSSIDLLVANFKKAVAELNSKQDTELGITGPATNAQATYQTFARCMDCHRKQAEFWKKTPHFKALSSLVAKKQARNKECLSCHSLGLGEANGFSDVSKIGALSGAPESASSGAPALTPEQLAEALEKGAFKTLDKAWAPVQCENCHGPSGNHPFGANTYSKKVEKSKCMGCHTSDRATEWHDKNSLQDKVFEEKYKRVSCPPGEL
ncbi:multiheme c-type cytochrome [Bdellovibrionota bacterium FG-2]